VSLDTEVHQVEYSSRRTRGAEESCRQSLLGGYRHLTE